MRERLFYEAFARTTPQKVWLGVISGEERPWNPYWVVHSLARTWYSASANRALDFGCGAGDTSVRLAKLGYRVSGFDISPANIAKAKERAVRYQVSDRTAFSVELAESLPYPDGSFDLIVGIDILHHVDIPAAIGQCLRVLAPGGRALFHEPVEAPIFEPLRNSRLGRWLVPKSASFDRHVTEDERKLSRMDLKLIDSLCPNVSIQPFHLFSRLDRFVPRPASLRWSPLERFDQLVFRWLPFMRTFRGKIILSFTQPGV